MGEKFLTKDIRALSLPLCSPDSQNPINLKINLFVKKCKTIMQPQKTSKSKRKKNKKSKKKHQKKEQQKKTRIRLDLKLVKYYYNYYSYNCNPF